MAIHQLNSFVRPALEKRQRAGALQTLPRGRERSEAAKRLGSAAVFCRFLEGEISQLSAGQIEKRKIQEDLRLPSKTICPVP
jgi:hypothetical protein